MSASLAGCLFSFRSQSLHGSDTAQKTAEELGTPGEGSRVKGTVKCFHTPMKQMQRHAARRGAVYSKLQQKAVVEFNLNLN